MTAPFNLNLDHAGLSYRGFTVEQLAAAGVPPADIAAAVEVALCAAIDARAEELRVRLVTPGSGQAMEYQETYAEAQAVAALLAANPAAPVDGADFPMLACSIGLNRDPKTGAPTTDAPGEARAALAAYATFQRAGAAIRKARLGGKAAIRQAATIAEKVAAAEALAWPF